jgi:hypothetical protein
MPAGAVQVLAGQGHIGTAFTGGRMWDQQRATDMEGADLLARTDLCRRNAYLNAQGVVPKMAKKTGTTITGLIYKVRRRVDLSRDPRWRSNRRGRCAALPAATDAM